MTGDSNLILLNLRLILRTFDCFLGNIWVLTKEYGESELRGTTITGETVGNDETEEIM